MKGERWLSEEKGFVKWIFFRKRVVRSHAIETSFDRNVPISNVKTSAKEVMKYEEKNTT